MALPHLDPESAAARALLERIESRLVLLRRDLTRIGTPERHSDVLRGQILELEGLKEAICHDETQTPPPVQPRALIP